MVIHSFQNAQMLVKNGSSVAWICGRHDPSLPIEEFVGGVKLIRIHPLFKLDRGHFIGHGLLTHLPLLFRAGRVVPLLPFPEAFLLALLPAFGLKLVPVFTCQPSVATDSVVLKWILRIIDSGHRAIISKSSLVGVSSLDYGKSIEVLRGAHEKLRPLPPMIEFDRFSRDKKPGSESHILAIGFVGRLSHEKGLGDLFDAFLRVLKIFPNAKLRFAGPRIEIPNDSTSKLFTEFENRLPRGTVEHMGHLSDVDLVNFYQGLSVLVLPSTDQLEALGMVQIEAMLCGTPVVASDMPGVRLPVQSTRMGLLFPPGDAAALADRICEVLASRESFVKSRTDVLSGLSSFLDPQFNARFFDLP